AVDRDRLGVYQRAAPEQLERDGTGRVIAAGERRRVLQDRRGRVSQRNRGQIGGGGKRGAGRAEHGLLGDAPLVVGGVVVRVAEVAGRPGVGASHRLRGGQRSAGRVAAVAVDRDGLGEREIARTTQREDDAAQRVKAALQVRRVCQRYRPRRSS